MYPFEIGDREPRQRYGKGASTPSPVQPLQQGLAKLLISQGRIKPVADENSARPAESQCLRNRFVPGCVGVGVYDSSPVGETPAVKFVRYQVHVLSRRGSAGQEHVKTWRAHASILVQWCPTLLGQEAAGRPSGTGTRKALYARRNLGDFCACPHKIFTQSPPMPL